MLANDDYWRWKQSVEGWLPKLGETLIPATCSCIKTARNLGIDIPYDTEADDLKSNTTIFVGALALFKYPNFSHVAVVTKLEASGFWVHEGNYKLCEMTKRFILYNDPALRGFWKSGALR